MCAYKFRTIAVDCDCDCDCGAGSDIEFLLSTGYEVFGYDNEDRALEMLSGRFKDNSFVQVKKLVFLDFDYPDALFIAADASLFFAVRSTRTFNI
ncbi:hypothetical protein [Aliiglaciecola sp. M165]|uniref:hypothetical protein n=1 Tax=Aliiglaciecola sp. M165 TaxID=2593649 RepID=UPI001180E7A7|nr:hypothetical protein [Aliiglaciecola sp. M165]TRY33874.1 hypothetical protein FM019_01030 [Aliiglaciecola sp. M165]